MRFMIITRDQDIIDALLFKEIPVECDFIVINEGITALELLSQVSIRNPNILLLDDDFLADQTVEFLKSIKSVRPDLEIIFLTADNSVEMGRNIIRLGVRHYEIKPLHPEYLRTITLGVIGNNKKKQVLNFNN